MLQYHLGKNDSSIDESLCAAALALNSEMTTPRATAASKGKCSNCAGTSGTRLHGVLQLVFRSGNEALLPLQ